MKTKRRPAPLKNPRKKVPRTGPFLRTPGLSNDELSYARQLVDPCGSQLKSPPIGGSEGSFIFRGRGIKIVNSGPTGNEYNGILIFHPTFGAYYTTGVGNTGVFEIADDLVFLPTTTVGSSSAGLPSRTVGACLKIRYLGAELNRQGKISMGVIPGQTAWSWIKSSNGGGGSPPSYTVAMSLCEHVSRMPPDCLEIAWVPGSIDNEFHEPQYYTSVSDPSSYEELLSRTNFIVVSWSGIGSDNCPLEFEATSIQEKFLELSGPTTFYGQMAVLTAGKRNRGSPAIMDKVINWLQSKDPRWYLNGAIRLGSMLGLGPTVSSITGMVGNMTLGAPRARQAIAYH